MRILKKLKDLKIIFLVIFTICIASAYNARTASAETGSASRLEFLKGQKERTYKQYDITNDGKADIIKIKKSGKPGEYDICEYKKFKVYINGKCALEVPYKINGRTPDMLFEFISVSEIQVLTLANKKSYLFLGYQCVGDSYPGDIFEYKNGKFKNVLRLSSLKDSFVKRFETADLLYNVNALTKVNGNKIYINTHLYNAAADINIEVIYKYKSGRLVLQSKTHKVTGYSTIDGDWNISSDKILHWLILKKPLQIYSDKELKKKTLKLQQGTELKIKKCYISGKNVSFYIETKNGKKGWFKVTGLDYGMVFNNSSNAG